MFRQCLAFFVAVCVIGVHAIVVAQAIPPTPKTAPQPVDSSMAKPERSVSGSGRNKRQALAISLLTSLADEARSYRDEFLRARIQARVADALWQVDANRARLLFRRAWEAAEKVDNDAAIRTEEERRRKLATPGGGLTVIAPPSNLRKEVLGLAAQRDVALGEELLAKLSKITDTTDENQPKYGDPGEPPLKVAKRLDLAQDLLTTGDLERAVQISKPALNLVTLQGIAFVSSLRQRDASLADNLYSMMLIRAAADPFSDATTVSVLSSYLFTPLFFVTVTRKGTMSGQLGGAVANSAPQAPEPSPRLRAAFFRTAAEILLRPVSELDRTLAGPAGTYFTIARLLPLFEQHAPDKVDALRLQLAALAADAPSRFRTGRDRLLTEGLRSENPPRDEVEDWLSQAGQSASSSERDQAYARAALAAAKSSDARARDFSDKIEDEKLREQVRAFVDFARVRDALEQKDVENAVRLTRTGNLTHLQRVWAYTEVARLVGKSDSAVGMGSLYDAAAEARRIDVAEPDRARAMLAIGTQAFQVDRDMAWNTTTEAVTAANSAEAFTGEPGSISAHFQMQTVILVTDYEVSRFGLTEMFSLLAKDDLYRSIDLARGLVNEAPRAVATIAIARSVLDRKPKRPAR